MGWRNRRHGFTLFELLVVISIMGVATTLGATMLSRVMDTWRRVSVRTELDAMAERVFEKMGKDFADVLSSDLSGVALGGITQTVRDHADFPGRALADDRIIIPIRTAPGLDRAEAGAMVMYKVERDNGRDQLVLTIGDLVTDVPVPIGGRIEMIPQARVLGLRFEYASKDGVWQAPDDEAGSFDDLPKAVRVSLALADRDFPNEQVARSRVFPIHVD